VLPIPATYLIDATGHVVLAHVEADYRERAEPLQVLEALRLATMPGHG
jgi:peroxiredoxin